jgi:ATP phosphoribosyltransferase regulatory subunit
VLIHYSLETIEEAERLRALYIKEGVKTELSMMSSLEETFSFARANKVAAVVDTSGGKLKEYAWKEKWELEKEGETSCVTFKSR